MPSHPHDWTVCACFVSVLTTALALSPCPAADDDPGAVSTPPWQCRDAQVRLRVDPATNREHLLRVDLPLNCARRFRGCQACLSDGREIPASPVTVDGSMVAVECLVPWLSRSSTGSAAEPTLLIEIYLFAAENVPLPCPPANRTPIVLRRWVRRLTTRPFKPGELVRLTATMATRFGTDDLHSFDAALPRDSWKAPPEKRTALLHWATDLLVAHSQDFWFGADRQHVAWFLFVNGEPVVDWRTGKELPGGFRRSRQHRLTPGLHRIELFAVQRENEGIPVPCLYSGTAFERAPLDPASLYSTRQPSAILFERKDSVLQPGLRLQDITRYVLPQTGREILTFRVSELAENFFGRAVTARTFRVGERPPVTALNGAFAVFGTNIPKLELTLTDELGYHENIVLPPRRILEVPVLMSPRLRVLAVPDILAAHEDAELRVRVEGVPDALLPGPRDSLEFAWRQTDRGGRVIAEGRIPASAAASAQDLVLDLDRRAGALDLDCRFAGTPLVKPVPIRVLRPDADLAGLHARGTGLWQQGDRAILVCDPFCRDPAASAGDPGRTRAAGRQNIRTLAVVDDYWAAMAGPNADLRPEDCLRQAGKIEVTRYPLTCPDLRGAACELRKFSLLGRVFETAPDAVLWCVGASELRSGMTAENICRHLLFLVQATQAVGATPVLMTVPSVPEVEILDLRRAALLTKELAVALGVPIADAYSQARGAAPGNGRFADAFTNYAGTVSLTTPHNNGRLWLCRLLTGALGRAGLLPEANE